MLDCCIPLETAQKEGVNMAQLYCLAKSNGLHPHAVNGKDLTLDRLRQEVKHVTKREDVVFIANYGRSMLGQTGDGHFSPIAGYHENRDLVLILDTARYKYPPHWVSLEALLDGMKDIDLNTGKPRGYIKLTVANDQTSPPPPPTLSELQMGSKMDDSLSQLLTTAKPFDAFLPKKIGGVDSTLEKPNVTGLQLFPYIINKLLIVVMSCDTALQGSKQERIILLRKVSSSTDNTPKPRATRLRLLGLN
ncbi:hypothetical protein RRG08_038588 [Elysia crispata]|uniref:glutathione gamma-glutamylcysteinyltransferase n=1 Tax=Elysia crispata TaxID=231223 RepID=A0AAE1ASJ4_9GAST|nr:hypothetical protein RRG08_038588 [Elysia crispata]